jgi:cell division protein FtsI (penicillin-binding protein 3)
VKGRRTRQDSLTLTVPSLLMPERPVEATRPDRWVKLRGVLAGGVLMSLFGLLGHRAWVLQVHEADKLKQMAEDQYLQSVPIPAKRGRILDRRGAELAASAEVDSVRVSETARSLAGALHLDAKEVDKRLRERRFFTWVKRRIPPDEARAVRELALPGVYIDREPRRYYPQRDLGGTLIGWAGLDSVGQEGIELTYDADLRGTPASVDGLRDALGRAVLIGGASEATGTAGNDLETTIDHFIQYRLERALEKGVAAHHAKGAVAVAMDPQSGEILAMASLPTLDPNHPNDSGRSKAGARNKAVTDPFEPGSTMKTFSILAAVENNLVRPDERMYCENGHWAVGPAIIHDAERIGEVTVTQVLAESSNICTAKIAFRTGKERMREMLVRMGFGKPTGVDLPGERAGNIRALPRMGPVETATTSFGQGMTATPLQVVTGYSTIGNGGTWYKPHILKRVVGLDGRTLREAPVEGKRVISEKDAATMRQLLFAVTQKGGTAAGLSLPGYTFAGKTGTAQKVDPATRRYSSDKWASSFVGFAPAENPRIALFVMVDEPVGTHYGSQVAGPIWQETMIDALRWLGVPTNAPVADGKQAPGTVAAPPSVVASQAGGAPSGAPKVAAKAPVRMEPAVRPGAGRAMPTLEGAVEPAEDAEGEAEVPDFSGLSVGEVLTAARKLGVQLEVVGSGLAVAQEPGPGPAPRGSVCRVEFSPPG